MTKILLVLAFLVLIATAIVQEPPKVEEKKSIPVEVIKEYSDEELRLKQRRINFIKKYNPKLDVAEAEKIVELVEIHSKSAGIDPDLTLSVIKVESTFKAKAVSKASAKGLMQVIPRYHPEVLSEAKLIFGTSNLFNPQVNIYVGVNVLRNYMNRSKNLTNALLRYNGSLGQTPVYSSNVLKTFRRLKGGKYDRDRFSA